MFALQVTAVTHCRFKHKHAHTYTARAHKSTKSRRIKLLVVKHFTNEIWQLFSICILKQSGLISYFWPVFLPQKHSMFFFSQLLTFSDWCPFVRASMNSRKQTLSRSIFNKEKNISIKQGDISFTIPIMSAEQWSVSLIFRLQLCFTHNSAISQYSAWV